MKSIHASAVRVSKSMAGILFAMLLAFSIVFTTGCGDALTAAEEASTAAPDAFVEDARAASLTEPTSVYDTATGEPVALNYDPSERVYADELPLDALKAAPVQGLNAFALNSWGPLHNVQIGQCCEASGTVPEGYFLTGIGARAKPGKVTTLHLTAQKIKSGGALGNELTWKFGSAPNHALEVYGEVPPGNAIIGVGFRNNDGNVTKMKLWYRQYDPVQEKLVGPTKTQVFGSPSAEAGLEIKYVHPQGDGRDFLTGLGVREANGDMKGLRVYYRWYGPWIAAETP